MTRFGDLIGGKETVVTPITTPPVVEKPAPVVEEVKGVTKQELMKLSKIELEELGREYGIELDRRQTKETLISQLVEANK